MKKTYLFSKLHLAAVTDSQIHYEGSITIDAELLAKAGIDRYEKVLVANTANGSRFETYAIPGNKGEIILNGATALLGNVGDRLIIFSFCIMDIAEYENHSPIKVFLNDKNDIIDIKRG